MADDEEIDVQELEKNHKQLTAEIEKQTKEMAEASKMYQAAQKAINAGKFKEKDFEERDID